ncbi:uncharacterized protein LOC126766938 [Bactrocera neohumeralis]|uniref:uncharacterized protein LOC126766938 n=1 Tax=Bactrocera neohumeralis TaxID=98809 RepID=UPI002165D5C5|nr:uncharacterized protein LOC126766938 [Bactrocera neohumeralis]
MSSTSNMFDESIFESQEENDHQILIPRKLYSIKDNVSTTSTPSQDKENVPTQELNTMAILNEILGKQREILDKIHTLESNQQILFDTLGSLNNGQMLITGNQEQITDKFETVEQKSIDRSEMLAQSSLIRECKVHLKKIERSVCLMTGEEKDEALDQVASLLPIQNFEGCLEVEEMLEKLEFAQPMISYVHKLKGTSDNIENSSKYIFADSLLEYFNFDGRGEKQALCKLKIFEEVLRVVYQPQGSFNLEKSIRRSIERGHH